MNFDYNSFVFNYDVLIGYVFGGFCAWAFIREKWMTLTAVSLVVYAGLLVDITRPLQ